jgi:hypothetical protein
MVGMVYTASETESLNEAIVKACYALGLNRNIAWPVWALELKGLPEKLIDNIGIATFLAWECGNIFWKESNFEKRIRKAFKSIRISLLAKRNIIQKVNSLIKSGACYWLIAGYSI